jgi:crotonobetainyl-CoA:carnitine CoA-transferase CaiB-like acyl-CoA transferase
LQRLKTAGIPCGEVLGLYEALTSERAVRGGLVTSQSHPVAGRTHVMAPPYRLDGERLPVRLAPPELGEATRDILTGMLGLDDVRLAELKALGVL